MTYIDLEINNNFNRENDIFLGCGVEITLHKQDDFLKIAETLTRIGIKSKKEKKLYQSCYILHKKGRYVIIHFLEMFILDGKNSTFAETDRLRRNEIALLLEKWKLLVISPAEKEMILQNDRKHVNINVLSYKEKKEWTLVQKYEIGTK